MILATGNPGVVLRDGEVVGLWRARKKGKRYEITLEQTAPTDELQAEADLLAPFRGCTSAGVG